MLDVLIALTPALMVSVYFFTWRALILTVISVASCVLFELLYQIMLKKPVRVGDLSAVVTGMLLAFCLPVTAPWWIPVVGGFFAIVIVKQLYGGIGRNFMNPALAGRAFLLSWPAIMTAWVQPFTKLPLIANADGVSKASPIVDALTGATPMHYLSLGQLPPETSASLFQMFIGQTSGCLGETSALVLLLGGIYLLVRRVITPAIPVAYIGTVALITFLTPAGDVARLDWMLYQLCGGGLMLGAIFMATDYSTSPLTARGQWIYGVGCGLITVFIRYFGTYPEGVSFSILIMNACVWLIDRAARPRRFGARAVSYVRAKGGLRK